MLQRQVGRWFKRALPVIETRVWVGHVRFTSTDEKRPYQPIDQDTFRHIVRDCSVAALQYMEELEDKVSDDRLQQETIETYRKIFLTTPKHSIYFSNANTTEDTSLDGHEVALIDKQAFTDLCKQNSSIAISYLSMLDNKAEAGKVTEETSESYWSIYLDRSSADEKALDNDVDEAEETLPSATNEEDVTFKRPIRRLLTPPRLTEIANEMDYISAIIKHLKLVLECTNTIVTSQNLLDIKTDHNPEPKDENTAFNPLEEKRSVLRKGLDLGRNLRDYFDDFIEGILKHFETRALQNYEGQVKKRMYFLAKRGKRKNHQCMEQMQRESRAFDELREIIDKSLNDETEDTATDEHKPTP